MQRYEPNICRSITTLTCALGNQQSGTTFDTSPPLFNQMETHFEVLKPATRLQARAARTYAVAAYMDELGLIDQVYPPTSYA